MAVALLEVICFEAVSKFQRYVLLLLYIGTRTLPKQPFDNLAENAIVLFQLLNICQVWNIHLSDNRIPLAASWSFQVDVKELTGHQRKLRQAHSI